MQNLNLLLHIDNFRWTDFQIDRSHHLDNLSEVIELLADCRDKCWHHPEGYNLCYDWGCIHDLIELGHREIAQKFEWMSYNNHKSGGHDILALKR